MLQLFYRPAALAQNLHSMRITVSASLIIYFVLIKTEPGQASPSPSESTQFT